MKKNLTYAEWMVMSVLWGEKPMSLSEVIRAMGDKMDWSYKTYSTYLRKLCEKGVVEFEARGRDKYYYALADREQCIRAESRSLIEKVSKKGVKEMVICMIEEGDLSPEDHAQLQEMLANLAKESDKS